MYSCRLQLCSTLLIVLIGCLASTIPLEAGDDHQDDVAPSPKDLNAAIEQACDLLVANQEDYVPDSPVGGFPEDELAKWQQGERSRLEKLRKQAQRKGAREWPYEGVYRVRGQIPAGYRVGGTVIVCEALLEAPGFNEKRKDAIRRAVRFMLTMIDQDQGMAPRRQTSYDVRGWGQAYALKFFLRSLEVEDLLTTRTQRQVKRAIPHLISCLEVGQVNGGGWNYAGRGVSPFMTGSTLIALFHAREAGYKVPQQMIEDALGALERARGESLAYAYSGRLRNEEEPMGGASARSAIAELCLYRAGRSDQKRLQTAIDGFFEEKNWQELLKRKSRQGTHKPPYGVAPYYFFFGHTYAALAVEQLPEQLRAEYRTRMQELLWRTIESNGSWNDRIFPRTQSYSTAMSVLALIAPSLPSVREFKPAEKKAVPL